MTYQIRRNDEVIKNAATIADAKQAVADDIKQSKLAASVGWLNAKQIHHLYTKTWWSVYKNNRVVANYTANG